MLRICAGCIRGDRDYGAKGIWSVIIGRRSRPHSTLPTPRDRILSLDVLRGVAVMAILLANLPGFALPDPAYSNPIAWGGSDQSISSSGS